MPANRMLHKRAGSGHKTNALSNLEFRAWIIYRLAADDFGVLRCDGSALVEAHPYFATEKPKLLQRALERLVSIGLVRTFVAQGLLYLYSHDWQDYERIEWPGMTTRPCLPPEVLCECTAETQRLFSAWPGGHRITLTSGKSPSHLPSHLPRNLPRELPTNLPRNLAPHAKANANANGLGVISDPEIAATSPERSVWDAWRALAQVASHVVLRLEPNALEYGKLAEICQMVPDSAKRSEALAAFWALDERECAKRNIKLKSLGYFVMALPGLLETDQSVASERAKFIAGTR